MVLVGEGGRKGALALSGVDGSRGVVDGCGVMASHAANIDTI